MKTITIHIDNEFKGESGVSDDQLAKIEEILKPKSKRFVPKMDEEYYTIDEFGFARNFKWECCEKDEYALGQNNVFQSKEEAEQHAEYLQAISDVTNYCYDNDLVLEDVDWDSLVKLKYLISYSNSGKIFRYSGHRTLEFKCSLPYLKSDDACQQVIDEQKDNLEIVFGVKKLCEHNKGLTDFCEPCGRVNC